MTDSANIPPEPFAFEREYFTDANFPARLTRAQLRYLFARPRFFVPWVVILVVLVLVVVTGQWTDRSFVVPSIFLVLLVALWAYTYFRAVSRLRTRFPTGSVFGIGLRSATFMLRSPDVTSEAAYSLYGSVERRGEFVFLKQRTSRITTILPAEIFTDESFEMLRAKITLPGATR